MTAIAVVGMACRYPDARSPAELWENVLARRRAFRPVPPGRLRLADYAAGRGRAPDATYLAQAAVLEGWEFDRVRFRVSGEQHRAADAAHWLALEVAAASLADAGFPGGEGVPREGAGVLVGNSLTGEFSRAGLMRLRWPYVRRVLERVLADAGTASTEVSRVLAAMEAAYKAPFPEPGGETLAGGLSNTIAGRICNHFDLHGGGWTVDGACASSLLAVATACSALAAGEMELALAGGVDLSLDPFELVGFARAGALAEGEMRVFDRRGTGFLPGEGCGMVVLVREADAAARGLRPYALIRGWGVSSDGRGGLTRPEAEGQRLALRRAYARAGFGPGSVAFFEAHGTGTPVGDEAELRALSLARGGGPAPAAAVGSVKALIGHTKAAAGVAGLIKAVMAVRARVIPPTAGCADPHPALCGERPALRVAPDGEPFPAGAAPRAGVSAMGFGGINTHVVLEGVPEAEDDAAASAEGARGFADAGRDRADASPPPPASPDAPAAVGITPAVRALLRSAQDAELLLLDADGVDQMRARVEALRARGALFSAAELGDAAAVLQRRLCGGRVRAAVVARTAAELARGLERLLEWLGAGAARGIDPGRGVFLGTGGAPPRIGLLFPGQGSPAYPDGGALRRRFAVFDAVHARAAVPRGGDGVATAVAQPAIAAASAAALALLRELGIQAVAAVGHSLGELAALHWAGALELDALLRIAAARGRAMAELGSADGAMLSLRASAAEAAPLLAGTEVVVAGVNAPDRTVVAGSAAQVERVAGRARERGVETRRLAVSHAFHSPLVAAAAGPLAAHLARETVGVPRRAVASTVAGRLLRADDDLRALLVRQVTAPVLFRDALEAVRAEVDLWIEAGPGDVLSGLAAGQVSAPVLALDAGGPSVAGVLAAAGCAFAMGAPVRTAALFDGRFTRPIDLERAPRFLANPCERAPLPVDAVAAAGVADARDDAGSPGPAGADTPVGGDAGDASHAVDHAGDARVLEVVRALVAARAELPPAAVRDDDLLLGDLHLSSLVVGQLVADAARRLAVPPPAALTDYAAATVAQLAAALAEARDTGAAAPAEPAAPAGVDGWVRPFVTRLVERPPAPRRDGGAPGAWAVFGAPDDVLAAALPGAMAAVPGGGVVVCVAPVPGDADADRLLWAARMLAERPGGAFVVAQRGGGGAGFARSLFLERPGTAVVVADVAAGDPSGAARVAAEAAAALPGRYTEAHYAADGVRREPVLVVHPAPGPAPLPLGPDDVLLVTGGGKGIAAECALALAEESGARLALLGRSLPEGDAALAANLRRLAQRGVTFRYLPADVADAGAVARAVAAARAALGPVTAVLHGAGANLPRRIEALDADAVHATLAPKLHGLRNVLAAVDPSRLRLLAAFGSIIARAGLRGEAHYALANEWMGMEVERFARSHPGCRALCLEWSVWAGVGMGERLGTVEALGRQGITPVTVDAGVAALRDLLAAPPPAVHVVVAGRFGPPPTLRMEGDELPLLRFLERPRVHYPGVELVADAVLSAETDPYLADHAVGGERLLPAVLGLEAMAQAAMALAGTATPPAFEDVSFARPVVVPAGTGVTVRVAALARGPGRVEVAVRCETTGFAVDHFRAVCTFSPVSTTADAGRAPRLRLADGGERVALDPAAELYGGLFFHAGRFRRLAGYRALRSRECVAEIAAPADARWFGAFLPRALVLGDPGGRDAAIHAIQACIPHVLLLPVAVHRLTLFDTGDDVGPCAVRAREAAREGNDWIYDLEVVDGTGRVRERWDGLRLRRAGPLAHTGGWAPALLGPYLERAVAELVPGAAVSAAVERDAGAEREARRTRALRRALGVRVPLRHRPDGRPEVPGAALAVSAAHAGGLALAVAGAAPLGCDVEFVTPRDPSTWRDLLGDDGWALAGVVASKADEEPDTAATRVWCAREALAKAGAQRTAPLVFASAGADGWVRMESGETAVASVALRVAGAGPPLVLAVAVTRDGAPVAAAAPRSSADDEAGLEAAVP
ncbi:MAG TPA: SDR family NAD(P)-dependent oxidoreductase [Longimicrobium sp.]|nr:SDR family NAD(P)-dependent oxidoreductase [Longimicrobium sp.]